MDSCPRKDNGSLNFRAKTPRFFKIILNGTIHDGKLGLPCKFVRKYGKDLSSSVVLKVPGGAKWQVELVKHDGEIWLQKGWQEFLQHYSLSPGSFLVFEYDQRNRGFSVIIFDKSATEIDYPLSTINEDHDEPNLEETENDVSVDIHSSPSQTTKEKSPLPFSLPNKKIKLENSTEQGEAKKGGASCQKQTSDGAVLRVQPLTAEEKAKVLDSAATNFKSKNPFFMRAMQPTYIHFGKVAIPASFAKKYFHMQCGNAILSTVDGKAWSVVYKYCFYNGRAGAKFGFGWKEFAHQNHLNVGDVCVFELVNRAKTTLKVVIFRHGKGNSKQLKQEKASSSRKFIQKHSSSKISEAVEAANKFISLNPFLKVNIRSSSLLHGSVAIQTKLFEECSKENTGNVILQDGLHLRRKILYK